MTRTLGPDNGSAFVFLPSGAPAAGKTATVYADEGCTTLADIAAYQPDLPGTPGSVIPTAQVITDENGQLRFWFPNQTPAPALYVRFTPGGPVSRVTADLQTQINTLSAATLPLSGGTVTGDITVGDATTNRRVIVAMDGAASTASLPNGITGHAGAGGLFLIGSADGGEDDGVAGHFDSTPHINCYHYQRAQNGSYGESVRHYMMAADAKACLAWWFPTAGYDAVTEQPNGSNWKPQAWVIAHSKANDNLSYHNHLSFETMSPTNGLITRLEIPFVDQETWKPGDPFNGVTTANIRTSDADFTVRASTGVLRVGGGNTYNKDILLSGSSERANSARRWIIRANTDTESGSNAGTNWQVIRCADDGSTVGTAIGARRSDGNVFLGTGGALSARLGVVWGTSGHHGIYLTPSATPGAAAAVAATMTTTTDRLLQGNVTGDASTARILIYSDGKHEWGDGAGARDTNLYRSAADTLRTDDSLTVGANLDVTGTATVASEPVAGALFVRKPSNEVLAQNSTTLQDDTHLQRTVAANGVYELSGMLIYDGTTTADMKVGFTAPVGSTLDWYTASLHTSAGNQNADTVKMAAQTLATAPSYGCVGLGTKVIGQFRGVLVVGGTGGVFKLQRAQQTAEASDVTVYAGSCMTLQRRA